MIESINPIRLLKKHNQSEKKDPAYVLPREVFLLIFDYLKAPEVYMASQVSKRWHAILKTHDPLWNRCATEFRIKYPLSKMKRHDVAWIMFKYIQGVSAIVFSNQQLDQRIVNYFKELAHDQSGRVICRFGHGHKEMIFQVSACYIFKRLPDLVLGMPSGILLDKLETKPEKSDRLPELSFKKSITYEMIELRARFKQHWVQIKLPKELEPIFSERFKSIAARKLISLDRREFWSDFGIIATAPYHLIKHNDILGEKTDFK